MQSAELSLEQPESPSRIAAIPIPRSFYDRCSVRATVLTAVNLGVIVGAGPAAYAVNWWPIYILAFLLVGARAQSLYILQHECMHWLLFRSRRTNDICGMLLSGALGTGLSFGRFYHFKHHRRVGRSDDPNLIWHDSALHPPGWSTFWFFASQLAGIRVINLVTRRYQSNSATNRLMVPNPVGSREMFVDLAVTASAQAVILAGIWVASAWWVYGAFFLLPLVTLTSFLEAVRSFSEHVLPGERGTTVAEEGRLFFMDAGRIELFFFSQFGFHFHHLHHLYPGVVTFKLSSLHQWLQQNDASYPGKYVRRDGYLRTALRYVLKQPITPQAA
ncbi:MAG TPA: fatty acid desaturase [Vicinamibacterales bacterium]|jgi:fatty acid desaturase